MSAFNSELRRELESLLNKATQGEWATGTYLYVYNDEGERLGDFDNCLGEIDEANAELACKAKNALPVLLDRAERCEQLERALQEIKAVDIGGPHVSAQAGFGAALKAIGKIRLIAIAALNRETDNE